MTDFNFQVSIRPDFDYEKNMTVYAWFVDVGVDRFTSLRSHLPFETLEECNAHALDFLAKLLNDRANIHGSQL